MFFQFYFIPGVLSVASSHLHSLFSSIILLLLFLLFLLLLSSIAATCAAMFALPSNRRFRIVTNEPSSQGTDSNKLLRRSHTFKAAHPTTCSIKWDNEQYKSGHLSGNDEKDSRMLYIEDLGN